MASNRLRSILPCLERDEAITSDTPRLDTSTDVGQGQQGTHADRGFLFITSTGTRSAVQNSQQLKSLRSHVMHNYLTRAHADREGSDQDVEDGTNGRHGPTMGSVRGQKLRFRLKPGALELTGRSRNRKQKTNDANLNAMGQSDKTRLGSGQELRLPLTGPSAERIDPFASLAIHLDPIDEAILIRFRRVERWPWCPINGQGLWLPFALSDPVVFHASMYSWSMSFRARIGLSPTILSDEPESELRLLHHKGAAISLINARLSDQDKAVSDETVAAIAALTNIALVTGSQEEATKHMQGLRLITEMRGGLSSFSGGIQDHLVRLVSYNDMLYSELFDEELAPYQPRVLEESWSTIERATLSGPLPGLGGTMLRSGGVKEHGVIEVLEDVRQLCYSEQGHPLNGLDEKARMTRGDSCHRLERRLRMMVRRSEDIELEEMDQTVWRAVAIAGLAYVHHHLRGNPLRYRQFEVLSGQLHDTLDKMHLDLLEFDFAPAMIVWVLSTACVVCRGGKIRDEFLARLAKACARFGLMTYEQFRSMLRGFLWTGQRDEEKSLELWQQVGNLLYGSWSSEPSVEAR